LKPLVLPDELIPALNSSKIAIVIDSDFTYCGASESIAYRLMIETGRRVHALGLEDRTAGFAPSLDNPTPTPERIAERVRNLLQS
jgi:hypothetical protein